MLPISDNVRIAPGTAPLERGHSLPPVPGGAPHSPPLLDRVGSLVRAGVRGVAGLFDADRAARAVVDPPPRALAQGAAGAEQVRVMTFNIRGGMGPHERRPSDAQLDLLARNIARHDPDIVLLQEVDDFAARSRWRDDLAALATRTGATSAVAAAPGTLVTGRRQELALLTFNGFRVDNARNIVLPERAGHGTLRRIQGVLGDAIGLVTGKAPAGDAWRHYSPRNALDAIVETPYGQQLRVVNTHLSGGIHGDQPARELLPLAAALDAQRGPTLLGGDFNVLSGSAAGRQEARTLARSGLADTFTTLGVKPGDAVRRSFPGSRSNGDIDRIYASPHFSVQQVRVDREPPQTSDHLPVIADLTLR